MAVEIQMRRDTAADWVSTNPTLAQGEWGLETDTGRMKIGDGATAWVLLSYAFSGIYDAVGTLAALNPAYYGFPAPGSYTPSGTALSTKYATLGAAQAAYGGSFSFVTSLTQTFEWAAIQACLNLAGTMGGGVAIELPYGYFGMGGSPTHPTVLVFPSTGSNYPITLRGGGRDGQTTLVWGTDLAMAPNAVQCLTRPDGSLGHRISGIHFQGPTAAITPMSDRWSVLISGSPTGGTVSINYNGASATWAYNASAASVQTDLRALGGGVASCTVVALTNTGGGGWYIDSEVAGATSAITAGTNGLTGGTSPSFTVSHLTTGQAAARANMSGPQHYSNHVTDECSAGQFYAGWVIGGNHNRMYNCQSGANWYNAYFVTEGSTAGNTYFDTCDFTGPGLASWALAPTYDMGGFEIRNSHFGYGPVAVYYEADGTGTTNQTLQSVEFNRCDFESCVNAIFYEDGTTNNSNTTEDIQFINCAGANNIQTAYSAIGYRNRALFDLVGYVNGIRFTDSDFLLSVNPSPTNPLNSFSLTGVFASSINNVVIESTQPMSGIQPLYGMVTYGFPLLSTGIPVNVRFAASNGNAEIWGTASSGSTAIPINTLVNESGTTGRTITGYTANSNGPIIGVTLQAAGTGGYQWVPVQIKGPVKIASVVGFSSGAAITSDPTNLGYVINTSSPNPAPYVGWALATAAASTSALVDIGRILTPAYISSGGGGGVGIAGLVVPVVGWPTRVSVPASSNTAFGCRCIMPKTGTLNNLSIYIHVQSGNLILGVYDTGQAASGVWTQLYSSGSVSAGTAGAWQNVGNPSLSVVAGQQLDFVCIFDNTTISTAQYYTNNNESNALALPTGFLPQATGIGGQLAWSSSIGSFTLPSTIDGVSDLPNCNILLAQIV